MEEGPRRTPGVHDDRAPGRADGSGRPWVLGLDAAIDLRPGVRVHVEDPIGDEARVRVGAGRDGLRAEGGRGPCGRHLDGDDRIEVALEADIVDHQHARGRAMQDQGAAVVAVLPAVLGNAEQAERARRP